MKKHEVRIESWGQQIDLYNFEGSLENAIEDAYGQIEYWEGEGHKSVRAFIDGKDLDDYDL